MAGKIIASRIIIHNDIMIIKIVVSIIIYMVSRMRNTHIEQ